jgi:hypothetical protein
MIKTGRSMLNLWKIVCKNAILTLVHFLDFLYELQNNQPDLVVSYLTTFTQHVE